MKKIVIVLLLLITQTAISQYKYGADGEPIPYGPQPEIGKPMPDFVLDNVQYYKKSKVSGEDFKGKWLFLDFWYRGCLACIKNFPKINEFQARFKDRAQFILVGCNDAISYGKDIDKLYGQLQKKMNLQLVAAFDSALVQRWNVWMFPHVIIIDPEGIVRFITTGMDMTADKVQDLLDGKEISFMPKAGPAYDPESVTDTMQQLIYRSTLTRWNGESQSIGGLSGSYIESNGKKYYGFRAAMVQLFRLYNLAYIGEFDWSAMNDPLYGKIYPYPVLEIKDSTAFKDNPANMDPRQQNYYNFSLSTPPTAPNNKAYIMQVMRNELKNMFGYEVRIERRRMPVWRLLAKPDAEKKLKSKGKNTGTPFNMQGDGGIGGLEFNNWPISYLVLCLDRFFDQGTNNPPFFDETGITYNIDIKIDALMTDKKAVIRELQRYGLDLVFGEKEMGVLVIHDPRN